MCDGITTVMVCNGILNYDVYSTSHIVTDTIVFIYVVNENQNERKNGWREGLIDKKYFLTNVSRFPIKYLVFHLLQEMEKNQNPIQYNSCLKWIPPLMKKCSFLTLALI